MGRNECGQSRRSIAAGLCWLALVALVVLTVSPFALGAPKDREFTQVYQHTYDEVFQASLQAIERMGMFVDAQDKDKGTISGHGTFEVAGSMGPVGKKCTFNIHIETLSTKPEARVTISDTVKGVWGGWADDAFSKKLFIQIQQVLSTYH